MEIEEQNVMKFGSIGDSFVYYRVACDCAHPECDLELSIERDVDYPGVYCVMTKKLRASAYNYSEPCSNDWLDFIRVFKNKIVLCFKIMFTGRIEVSETLILRSEKQISNFVSALNEGLSFLEETGKEKS